jgi:hypothetical protein
VSCGQVPLDEQQYRDRKCDDGRVELEIRLFDEDQTDPLGRESDPEEDIELEETLEDLVLAIDLLDGVVGM